MIATQGAISRVGEDALARRALIACMEVWGGNRAFSGAVSVPGIDAEVHCTPHVGAERGGDIYYISNCAAGIITRIVLADVSGHGEEVGETANHLRRLMRKHINTVDQSRFARALNEEFGALAASGRFATALLLTYFAPTDHLIVCSAGHPPPLFYRALERRWGLLHAETEGAARVGELALGDLTNLPLGVIEPTAYSQFAVELGPGDIVVLYSDALTEARAPGGPMLGTAGLLRAAESLAEPDPITLREGLLRAVHETTGGSPMDDDATLVVLHHNASNPQRQNLRARAATLGRLLGLG